MLVMTPEPIRHRQPRKDRDVGEAIRIEERLHDLFAGRRERANGRHRERESPREMEQRAMERLYGDRSKTVTRVEQDSQS
jgi:hypothetical protein